MELQGTGEEATFSKKQLLELLDFGEIGIKQLMDVQHAALGELASKIGENPDDAVLRDDLVDPPVALDVDEARARALHALAAARLDQHDGIRFHRRRRLRRDLGRWETRRRRRRRRRGGRETRVRGGSAAGHDGGAQDDDGAGRLRMRR